MAMEFRNPVRTTYGQIDCEVNHPALGWVPTTVNPDDDSPEMQDLWEALQAVEVAPYVAPAVTKTQVRDEAARRMRVIGAPYSREERETWATQVAEAEAGDGPLLTALAAARGLTKAEMAALIIGKRDAYAAACGAVLASQASLIASDPIPSDYRSDTHWPAWPGT